MFKDTFFLWHSYHVKQMPTWASTSTLALKPAKSTSTLALPSTVLSILSTATSHTINHNCKLNSNIYIHLTLLFSIHMHTFSIFCWSYTFKSEKASNNFYVINVKVPKIIKYSQLMLTNTENLFIPSYSDI